MRHKYNNNREQISNDYLNFIKKNHINLLHEESTRNTLLKDQRRRSQSKAEKVHDDNNTNKNNNNPLHETPTIQLDKTYNPRPNLFLNIESLQRPDDILNAKVEQPTARNIKSTSLSSNGTTFNSSNSNLAQTQPTTGRNKSSLKNGVFMAARIEEQRLTNAEIAGIIDSKKKNIMQIVYESVQLSLTSKKYMIRASMKDPDISKQLQAAEKEINQKGVRLKFPGLKKEKSLEEQPSTICYNDYIKQGILESRPLQALRKSHEVKPNKDKRLVMDNQRYLQNDKFVQTFYYTKRNPPADSQGLIEAKGVKQNIGGIYDFIEKEREETVAILPDRKVVVQFKKKKPLQPISITNLSPEQIQKQVLVQKQEQEEMTCEEEEIINFEETTDAAATLQKMDEDQETRKSSNAITTSTTLNPKVPLIRKKYSMLNKERQMTVYEHKISTYRDLIFKLNFCHGRFNPLILKDQVNMHRNQGKFRAYVGRGNNSQLVKGLLKRRYWWVIEQNDMKSCHFVWTQLKVNDIFQKQTTTDVRYARPPQEGVSGRETPLQKSRTKSETKTSSSPKKHSKKQQTQNSPKKKQAQIVKQPSKPRIKPQVPTGINKIMHETDLQIYTKFQEKCDPSKLEDMEYREKLIQKKLLPSKNTELFFVHNHLECNYFIGNKKAMFYNLKQYYDLKGLNVFDYLPLTFHIKKGMQDKEYAHFLKYYKKRSQLVKLRQQREEEHGKKKGQKALKNIWIVKPGEVSNRGNGITVIDEVYELNNILKDKKNKHANGTEKTYIVQAYLDNPMLYNRRKFDIRHYMLITTLYGKMRAYWYCEGYIRTSSMEFTLEDITDPMVHLTNDAIQKYGANYGKYEEGNKLSYAEFQRYLDTHYPDKHYSFFDSVYPKMRQVATDAIRASYIRLDPRRLEHNFQIFGLDFMIDSDFKPWLIEINTNPCLEISSGLLSRIIPTMVQHSFRLSLDVLFPPFAHYPNTQKHLAPDNALDYLKFELIFDEEVEGYELQQLFKGKYKLDCGEIEQDDEVYDNEGAECKQDDL